MLMTCTRAGTKNLIHMHGELLRVFCTHCGHRRVWEADMTTDHVCMACGTSGTTRPDIVWFGEMPYQMDRINAALQSCDLFVSIGTSGQVYPAAGFVQTVRYFKRAQTLELNLDPTDGSPVFHDSRFGPATKLVTQWVAQLLS
jgi:NAD-dependent deacetylase